MVTPRNRIVDVLTDRRVSSPLFNIVPVGLRRLTNISVGVVGVTPPQLTNVTFVLNVTELDPGTVAGVTVQCNTSDQPTTTQLNLRIEGWVGGDVVQTTAVLEVRATNPRPMVPFVMFSPPRLTAQAALGDQTMFTLTATNMGETTTGDVAVVLPSDGMLSVVAPMGTVALTPRQSINVTLMASVNASIGIGRYTGQFGLFGVSSHTTVDIDLAIVSTRVTELIVQLQDEATFFSSSRPTNWSGSPVTIVSQQTRQSITTYANSSGHAVFANTTEGVYSIAAQSTRHRSDRRVALLAGMLQVETFFLPFAVVSFTWTVTPTLLQDRYTFILDITYETDVPAPVIAVVPAIIDVDVLAQTRPSQVLFTITNRGLINTDNTAFRLPTLPFATLVPLVALPAVLAPNVSLIYPVRVVYTNTTNSTRQRRTAGAGARPRGCGSGEVQYDYLCGGSPRTGETPVAVVGEDSCDFVTLEPGDGGGSVNPGDCNGDCGPPPGSGTANPGSCGQGGCPPPPGGGVDGGRPYNGRIRPGNFSGLHINPDVELPCNPCNRVNQMRACIDTVDMFSSNSGVSCAAASVIAVCDPSPAAWVSAEARCAAHVVREIGVYIGECAAEVFYSGACMLEVHASNDYNTHHTPQQRLDTVLCTVPAILECAPNTRMVRAARGVATLAAIATTASRTAQCGTEVSACVISRMHLCACVCVRARLCVCVCV